LHSIKVMLLLRRG